MSADQLPLFGAQRPSETPPVPSSLFFALRPDEPAAVRIHALTLRLREMQGLKGAPFPLERLHVTLCFLGTFPGLHPELLGAADAAGKAQRCEPFELTFDRVTSFGSRREGKSRDALPLVLCRDDDCPQLSALRARLAATLAGMGCACEPRSFRPHVTLLYDRKMVSVQQVAPICWTVREMLLVRSLVGRGEHRVLARYALGRDTP